ncbi:MAG: AAA family ATPase [Bacteroidetes bacterium]|nr:AAA family ATPase [Bacteroidota bacterium]
MFQRNVYPHLASWKNNPGRRPLIVRGARQVVKTHLIREFGKKEYQQFSEINFERNPEFKEVFSTYNPKEIVEKLSLFFGKNISSDNHLLFLDEIQECPQAITSLRYFFEEMPGFHVISAGSLLEFVLESQNFKVPVGRIQYLFMYPMSFAEYLSAMNEVSLRDYLLNSENLKSIPDIIHNKLIEFIRKYFMLGGMPGVLMEYLNSGDMIKCQQIQKSILDTYLDDFSKYSSQIKQRYLQKVFHAVPLMIGDKFVYANVDNTIKSRELKEAFGLLEMAGVIRRVRRTSGEGYPFEINSQDAYFKAIFLDVGLIHSMQNIYVETIQSKELSAVFRGIVAEQFVGQEILANSSPFSKPSLYYWARDARGSNAEIDYLIAIKNQPIPIEVKSGSAGHLKSINLYMDTYNLQKGIKISHARFDNLKRIVSFPLYAMESIEWSIG